MTIRANELGKDSKWQPITAPRESLSLMCLFAGPFIIVACSVAPLPGWNYAVKVLGLVLTIAFILRAVFSRTGIAPESILYLAWTGWCLVPGATGLAYPPAFYERWFTIAQTCMLIMILTGFTENRPSLSFCLGSLLCALAIVGAYSVFSGEWQQAERSGERVASLALNANELAYGLLLATMSLAYFWTARPAARPFRRLLLIAGLVLCAMGIWGSGSRKAIVSLVLFYPLWIWFCYRKEVARKPALLIFVVMALTAGAAAFTVGVKGSATGDRLAETWEFVTGQRSKGGGSERLVLYSEAIRVFAENPVVGIGMGQFVYVNRTYHMSHSDVMEVATGSGLPGLILYLSIIVVFWRRCGRIARWSSDPDEVRLARLFRVCVVVLFLIALGRTNSGSKTHWVFMASLIGYTAAVHRRLLGGEQGVPVLTPPMESWHEYSSVGQFQPATPPIGRRNT